MEKCAAIREFLIETPTSHHRVNGVCLHPMTDGSVQVRGVEGEVIAVAMANGTVVVEILDRKEC